MVQNRMVRLAVVLALGLVFALSLSATAAQNGDDQPAQPPLLGIAFEANDAGARVTAVLPGSPADEAGLETGDIVTALNGEAVTADTIADAVAALQAGDEVALTVRRGDETLDLNATLAERSFGRGFFNMPDVQMMERPYLGVRLEDTENGVRVAEVMASSPAADAGLQVGDIVTGANGDEVTTARALVEIVQAANPGDTLALEISRNDETQTVDVTLGTATAEFFGRGAMPDMHGNRMPGRGAMPFGFEVRINGSAFAYDGSNQTWQIISLEESNPLYEAGLRAGDVVTQIDGTAYAPDALGDYLDGLEADATVTVTVERDGETQDLDVPASALQQLFAGGTFGMRFRGEDMPFGFMEGAMGGTRLGIQFATLDEQVAQEHNLDITDGALVTEVLPNSPAAEANVQVDDVITAVNGEAVDAEHTLRDRLVAYEAGDTVTLTLVRNGETQDVDVTLGEMSFSAPVFEQFGFPRGFFFGNELPDGFSFEFPFRVPMPGQQQDQVVPNV